MSNPPEEEDDDDMSGNHSSSSSEDAEPVEAAVLSRGRRATAGRRLMTLSGQAAQDDADFWGHDTWEDPNDDDNASFRESDEDSEQRVDAFDSDFDDDEGDAAQEEGELAKAQQAEADMARQEREERKKKKGGYGEINKKRGMRRIVGDGLNAGIVLNAPGQLPRAPLARTLPGSSSKLAKGVITAAAAAVATVAITRKPRRMTQQSKYSSRFRSARHASGGESESSAIPAQSTSSKRKLTAAERAGDKKKPKRYKQEQLLLEAVHETEPANRRWLLQRQRNQTELDEAQLALDRKNQASAGQLIMRYTSRRGALNLIHFPDMNHVPVILRGQAPPAISASTTRCAVTGQPARYRDPLTGMAYVDSAAFRELRRRHAENPITAGRPVAPPPPPSSFMALDLDGASSRELKSNPITEAGKNAANSHAKTTKKAAKGSSRKSTKRAWSTAVTKRAPKAKAVVDSLVSSEEAKVPEKIPADNGVAPPTTSNGQPTLVSTAFSDSNHMPSNRDTNGKAPVAVPTTKPSANGAHSNQPPTSTRSASVTNPNHATAVFSTATSSKATPEVGNTEPTRDSRRGSSRRRKPSVKVMDSLEAPKAL
jgi:vacuolar protein sorting-associated protein 72